MVSSADRMKSSTFDVQAISFILSINSNGHNIDPCGIPLTISRNLESNPLYETYCVLLLK